MSEEQGETRVAKLGRNRISAEATMSENGRSAPDAKPEDHCCAICGQAASGSALAIERFRESFCSEGHAEEFVKAVRAARTQTAAAASSTTEVQRPGEAADRVPKPRHWRTYLGKALCWGTPLLALVFLLGGGGAVLGAASALLPIVALLACPLGMYFMMRSMSKMDDKGTRETRPGERRIL